MSLLASFTKKSKLNATIKQTAQARKVKAVQLMAYLKPLIKATRMSCTAIRSALKLYIIGGLLYCIRQKPKPVTRRPEFIRMPSISSLFVC